ncbi:MAG: serine/threonine-protein kinase, partial [Planctomycetota bacterium]
FMKKLKYDDLEMLAVLGTGTVGSVHRARIQESGQEVAVKFLQDSISGDELVRKRFRREMEILQRLTHPHIIRYFGGGEHEGRLFFAMELLDGGNARDLLERFGRFSWQEAASIGRQVCGALQAAHNNGIIHRDLKPGNLFFNQDAEVKLGDFGIARDTLAADITSQGLTVGTHAYMAPEQIKGETANGKADLYALGCVLFEFLTGHKPFEGVNFAILFEQHLHKRAPRVTEYIPDCPERLADVVEELLEKDPDKRPFNARAVQGVLSELLASYGLNAEGSPVSPNNEDVGAANVTEQDVIDPGMSSLRRKIAPSDRPEVSWKAFIALGLLVLVILLLANFAGNFF